MPKLWTGTTTFLKRKKITFSNPFLPYKRVSITERQLDFHIRRIIISKKIKKTVEPVVDKIVHYYDDENGNLVRSRQVKIGKTIYTIISREKPNAKSTAFDITKRLIESQAESLTDDLSITTESLEGCNSGGKK